jgi:hypothetical protein
MLRQKSYGPEGYSGPLVKFYYVEAKLELGPES